jgi:microcystin degradation protein MlrC
MPDYSTTNSQSSPMKKRIALLGIYHETNTFIDSPTTLDDFRNGYWLEGAAIRTEYEGAHHEISGIIEVLDSCADVELIPVLYVSATPGGKIAKEASRFILEKMMSALESVLPVDGCIIVPHGAAVSEEYTDMDGHWMSLLRTRLGNNIPITGTLDPHANVSRKMVDATNALVAYATNPHIDQYATGKKAAMMMVNILRGKIEPLQQLVQLPMAISIEQQNTSQEPCADLYDYVNHVAGQHDLLSASVILGFPYADVEEMGSAYILIADKKKDQYAEFMLSSLADHLEDHIIARKEDFNGPKKDIHKLLPTLLTNKKPALLLDMGDNVGGGAPGNSTYLLAILEQANTSGAFICIDDPQAVEEVSIRRSGESFQLKFGQHDNPFESQVSMLKISDGIFTEDTPKHGGFVNYNMGPTAIIKTEKGNTVMLTSKRTPPYSLRQMTAFGLQPETFDFIIAKGVNAPIAAYTGVCQSIIQIDTPGVTQADMTLFDYKNRRKPLYPFE